MNFKRSFFYIFAACAIIFAACQRRSDQNKNNTIINVHFEYAVRGPLYLTGYADFMDKYLGIKTTLDTAKNDGDGNFHFKLNLKAPGNYDLQSGDSVYLTSIFVLPNNELTINFNRKSEDPVIDTSNLEGKYNDFRVKLTWKFFKENNTSQFYYIGANYLTLSQFDTFVLGRRNEMMAFYNSYFKGYKTSPYFEKFAKADIKYQYGIDKMMFLWKHRIKDIDIFPDTSYYNDITTRAYLNDTEAMTSTAYYHYLNLYINNIYGENLSKNHLPTPASPDASKYVLALTHLEEPARDIAICNIIYADMTPGEYRSLKADKSKPLKMAMIDWFYHKHPEIAPDIVKPHP